MCPLCNGHKFKKCCKPKVNLISKYGTKRLKEDLSIIETEISNAV